MTTENETPGAGTSGATDQSESQSSTDNVVTDSSFVKFRNEMSEEAKRVERCVNFWSPSQIRAFKIPVDSILLGDCHLVRGSVTLIGGQPGAFKSRALVALAIAGATGQPWFGLNVCARFKMAILQNENGMVRLKQDFDKFDVDGLDDYIRICEPPEGGLALRDPRFCLEVWNQLEGFNPDVIAIDPFSSIAVDDRMPDYREALDLIRNFSARFQKKVALLIVAHSRKPSTDERPRGRRLLHEFSGSHVLTSVARCAFVMEHFSTGPDDHRIVFTCCKNNDGTLGNPTGWQWRNGFFFRVEDSEMENLLVAAQPRRTVTADDIRAVLADKMMTRNDAVNELMNRTGLGKSACYAALNPGEKFRDILEEKEGQLRLRQPSN